MLDETVVIHQRAGGPTEAKAINKVTKTKTPAVQLVQV